MSVYTYIDKILLSSVPHKLSFKSKTIFIFLMTFSYKHKTWCRDVLSRDSFCIFCIMPVCTSLIHPLWFNKETQPFPLPTSPLHTTGVVSVLNVCITLVTSGLFCISHQTTTSWSLLIIAFDSSGVINIILDTELKCVFVVFLLKTFMAFHITCYAFISMSFSHSIPVMGCCFCLIQGCLL